MANRRYGLTVLVALAVAACSSHEENSPTPEAKPAAAVVKLPEIKKQNVRPISLDELAQKTAHIKSGHEGGPTLYVFCNTTPNCLTFWKELAPLKESSIVVWIPITGHRPNSLETGVALLDTKNPEAMLDALAEQALKENKLATPKTQDKKDEKPLNARQVEKLKANEALSQDYGVTGVPFVIGLHVGTNKIVTMQGAQSSEDIKKAFGI